MASDILSKSFLVYCKVSGVCLRAWREPQRFESRDVTHDLICILEGISGCSVGESLGRDKIGSGRAGWKLWQWSRQEMMAAYRSSPASSLVVLILPLLLLLLLSRFSRVWLCATPQMAAHQAPPSLGFFRQEHWSGLPFPSPMHESEKWKWSHSVCPTLSDPMDCSPPGSSIDGIFQARVLEWGTIAFSDPATNVQ